MMGRVEASRESRVIPTYGLGAPERNPLFFEKRVYQGSCGKVYPVPFVDKVFDTAHDQRYDAVRLENDFVRLVMLPEIGGRIFLGQDKVNSDYDFFYRQEEIKPALVGLAGPWLSGGVEFNWPQHHRPGTYMPTDVHMEESEDGSKTAWLSEHDPLTRMKGMHGICLRPDSALVELLYLWHFSCASTFLKDTPPAEWVTGYLNGFSALRGPVFRREDDTVGWRRRRPHFLGHWSEIARGCLRYQN